MEWNERNKKQTKNELLDSTKIHAERQRLSPATSGHSDDELRTETIDDNDVNAKHTTHGTRAQNDCNLIPVLPVFYQSLLVLVCLHSTHTLMWYTDTDMYRLNLAFVLSFSLAISLDSSTKAQQTTHTLTQQQQQQRCSVWCRQCL